MNVTAVESSSLRTIAYDESSALLRVEFQSRAVYDYFGVPTAVHEALLRASSIGASFNAMVRGRFRYDRVLPLDAEGGRAGKR